MKNLLEKSAIIELKLKGMSNRRVARTLGIDMLINIGISIMLIF